MTKDQFIDIENVLSKLTLEEKIALTSGEDMWHTKAIPRLGVRSVRVTDGPNGVRGIKFFNNTPTACCPSGSALTQCWNKQLMYKVGKMNGQQCRAKGAVILMGPNINFFRSPVNGRSFETFGEDPMLSGILASQYCNGVQSEHVGICPKHLVCNEKERFRMTANNIVSERALREIYLLPFMLVQKYSNPAMYMTSYSKLNGTFCSENSHLLKDIMRKEWKFDGAFVSDWFGTMSNSDSMNAGLTLEMPGPTVWRGKLTQYSIFHNTTNEYVLDDLVRHNLKLVHVAERSGIPEHPVEGMKDDQETTNVLLQSAREAIVLLKNNHGFLPLSKKKKVLVIGQAAKVPTYASGGCTYVIPYRSVSLYEGLVSRLGNDNVHYELGAPNRTKLGSYALLAASGKPNPILYRVFDDPRSSKDREPISEEWAGSIEAILSDFDSSKLRNPRQLYAQFQVDVKVPETAKYTVHLQVSGLARIFLDDKLVAVNDKIHKTSAAFGLDAPEVYCEVELTANEVHRFEVEFESTLGRSSFINGYGYLLSGISKAIDVEQTIKEAATKAAEYEQVVVVTGLNKDFEVEGLDRKDMSMTPYQNELVEAVLHANSNAVVVIESGTPLELPWIDKCSTLVRSSYLGNELGNALSDVLIGDYNPSGKLTFTWPKRYQDHPTYLFNDVGANYELRYAEDIYAGYRYFDSKDIEPLFPFGYGLSYTKFEFSDLSVKKARDKLTVSVSVQNIGSVEGSEVVQVYVGFQSELVPRATKQLKGFDKVSLRPNETKSVSIDLDVKYSCSFYNEMVNKWMVEKGVYKVLVGNSSRSTEFLEANFEVESTLLWSGL